METALIFGIGGLIAGIGMYVKGVRSVRSMLMGQEKIIAELRRQTGMAADSLSAQEQAMETLLADSRRRMAAFVDAQTEKDVKRIGKTLDAMLSAYTASVFARADQALEAMLRKSREEVDAQTKQRMSEIDDRVRACIRRAAKSAIMRGLPLAVHEDAAERAIREAVSEMAVSSPS